MKNLSLKITLITISILLLFSCKKDELCPCGSGPTDNLDWQNIKLFDNNNLIEIELTLDPADWDEIRHQVRNERLAYGRKCDQPPSNPFTYAKACITINGVSISNTIGLRKKGWFSSTEIDKPSLKVKLDKYVNNIKIGNYSQFTLNNGTSDPSLIRQCLAFQVFEAADIPTPKCKFAHVKVNGKDLGIYTLIQTIDEQFLQDQFNTDDGDFFEGTEADFRYEHGWIGRFGRQTNEGISGYGRIPKLASALEASDENLINELDPLIDLDRFFTFWGTEVLVGHVDGYAASAANFFIYDDPLTGNFRFVPWDLDYTFNREIDSENGVRSVYANAQLVKRLYLFPKTRTQYLSRLDFLLNNVWEENNLNASIDNMEDILGKYLTSTNKSEILKVREYVNTLRSRITRELTNSSELTPVQLKSPCGK